MRNSANEDEEFFPESLATVSPESFAVASGRTGHTAPIHFAEKHQAVGMGDEDGAVLSVDEFVEYCWTQVRFLSGSIQTMGTEADELLDEIDAEMAEIRTQLDGEGGSVERTDTPASTDGPDEPEESGVDVAALEERESSLETKQAEVEAKQARMEAAQELADGYTALAEELASEADDGQSAMKRVVAFEADRDAPAYFAEQTVLEAARATTESDGE